ALHALGVLHRGARAAVEFAGGADFLSGGGPPLLRPSLRIDGVARELGEQGLAWERAMNWLPTFTCSIDGLVIRGTLFAPYGRDADIAGAVYAFALENRTARELTIDLALDGVLGHRQLRVRTARPTDDAHRIALGDEGVVVLEGSAQPGLAALAVAADGESVTEVQGGDVPRFAVRRALRLEAGGRTGAAFYIAAGPERDGAEATVAVMRRRGWSELLTMTRDALQELEQTVGHDGIDRIINRNLLFAYFYGAVERPRRHDARLGCVRLDASRDSVGRCVAGARAAAARLRAARLRAGQRRALSRRDDVRAGLFARGRRVVRDRHRPVHPRDRRRSDRR